MVGGYGGDAIASYSLYLLKLYYHSIFLMSHKKSCQGVPEWLSWQDCYNVLFYADFINEEERRLTLS